MLAQVLPQLSQVSRLFIELYLIGQWMWTVQDVNGKSTARSSLVFHRKYTLQHNGFIDMVKDNNQGTEEVSSSSSRVVLGVVNFAFVCATITFLLVSSLKVYHICKKCYYQSPHIVSVSLW